MTTDIKDIDIRPKWLTAVRLLIAVVVLVLSYLLVDYLTDRVQRANDTAQAANDRADVNAQGVRALASQVEGLGATPVVTPSDLPQPGADGLDGADGSQGPVGPAGADGRDGRTGGTGATGAPGAEGASGGTGAPGTAGEAGAAGSDGPAGPAGPAGPEGQPGPAGPAGPQGEPGTDGTDGTDGADGAPGAAGQTCPDGYMLAERTIVTAENPLGEPGYVCVVDPTPTDPAPEPVTPVRN